ncbi:MAG TPA: cupredoxin domain-containing protein [Stellaceae bacterium]|jgi:plastocyanin
MRGGWIALAVVMALAGTAPWPGARADDAAPIAVTIKDHKFSPAEIHVPAGKAATLKITNQDPTAEEFDSTALKVEKVIVGGTWGLVHLHPLGPGKYPFMGEYHSDTAQGVVVSE